jgi:hypothetical protein
LDHYSKCIAGANGGQVVRYDQRARATAVETDCVVAAGQIDHICTALDSLKDTVALSQPVRVAFMLDATGAEETFESTLGRELAFCTHHAIHHNAMIAVITRGLGVTLPGDGFGVAPSTKRAAAEEQV